VRPTVEVLFDDVDLVQEFPEVILDLSGCEIECLSKRVEVFSRMGGDVLVNPVTLVGHESNLVSRGTVRE
jgi:hypothetical protein